ncbi:Hypothetical protein FKW44_014144 [Caligus rogercresseyi]|uniref:Uncharacterized protein n=1 Tax=Caligus rogercresseyi TaxID=217165 RepID=A0A7T8GYR5_CALRO|nr:Hypothetical protein FKW44_014144 [Caligus rogercresseyi]
MSLGNKCFDYRKESITKHWVFSTIKNVFFKEFFAWLTEIGTTTCTLDRAPSFVRRSAYSLPLRILMGPYSSYCDVTTRRFGGFLSIFFIRTNHISRPCVQAA